MTARGPTLPAAANGASVAEFINSALKEARRIALSYRREALRIAVKGRGNIVTDADHAVEETVVTAIREQYPDHAILAEESQPETRAAGWMWVLDPIDGTKNYSVGIPFYCSTLALCHDGEPVAGGTIDIPRGEFFYAEAGRGLTIDGASWQGSSAATIYDSVIGMDLGYSSELGDKLLAAAQRIYPNWQALRITGSAALGMAQCAAGRYDIFIHCYVFPWDTAAGLLLVREGGGQALRLNGTNAGIEDTALICGSEPVIAEFLDILEL